MSGLFGLSKNELYKIFKQKKLYLFMGVILAVQLSRIFQSGTGGGWQTGNAQSYPLDALAECSLFITMFIAVFIAEMIVEEYKRGTFKLVLLRPVNRMQFFSAKSIGILVCIGFMVCFTVLAAYGLGLVFFPWGEHVFSQGEAIYSNGSLLSDGKGVLITLTAAFFYMLSAFGFAMLILFIALLSMNVGITIGAALSLFMFAPLLKGRIQDYSIVHMMNTFPSSLINGVGLQPIFSQVGVVLAYIVIFYIGGLIFIKRKDVLL